jgi:hypothetical protein
MTNKKEIKNTGTGRYAPVSIFITNKIFNMYGKTISKQNSCQRFIFRKKFKYLFIFTSLFLMSYKIFVVFFPRIKIRGYPYLTIT